MASLTTKLGEEQVQIIGILSSPTPGATVTLTLVDGVELYKWTAGEAETVNCSGTQKIGQTITCQILDSGGRTITFGTGFKASDTIAGTNGKTATITFRSDGTNFYELSRTLAIT